MKLKRLVIMATIGISMPVIANTFIPTKAVAQKDFSQDITREKQLLNIHLNDAETYYSLGNAYYNQKKWESALTDYNKAIEINPNYADAYFSRGMIWIELGDKQKAINDLQTAAKISQQQGNTVAYKKIMDAIEKI